MHSGLILTFRRESIYHLHTLTPVSSLSYTALFCVTMYSSRYRDGFFVAQSARRHLYFDLTPDTLSRYKTLLFLPLKF
jgi:hypothetical protein